MKPVNHSRKPMPTPITTSVLAALKRAPLARRLAARRTVARTSKMPIAASTRMMIQ
jgi:hypothetical protein